MMRKAYTAKQMRDAALFAETVEVPDPFYGHVLDGIAAMLRQVANAMERKKKREKKRVKKYEYSYRFLDGTVAAGHCENPRMVFGDPVHGRILVRREVGNWEEVKDGD